MIIRKITAHDLADLYDLYLILCGENKSIANMEKIFPNINNNPDYFLLGAEIDGRIVGTVMGIICHDLAGSYDTFMTIENVIVLEDYRGRGIAKALFNQLEDIAKNHGCWYMYLMSSNSRTIAHQMYRHLGFDSTHATGFKKFLD